MNAQVLLGYGTGGLVESDPRRAEALILSQLAGELIRAAGPDGGFPALAAALHGNRRFWRVAAADLARDTNRLPVPLRAQLLSLAGFVDRETGRILAGEADAAALIEINRALARGLFQQPDG